MGQGRAAWDAEEGPGRAGGGREEEGREGEVVRGNPEVGYWAKPQASTPLLYLHHPLYHRQRDNPDHYHQTQILPPHRAPYIDIDVFTLKSNKDQTDLEKVFFSFYHHHQVASGQAAVKLGDD